MYRLCDIATLLTGFHQADDGSLNFENVKIALELEGHWVEDCQKKLAACDPRIAAWLYRWKIIRVTGDYELSPKLWQELKAIYKAEDIKQELFSPYPPQTGGFDKIEFIRW